MTPNLPTDFYWYLVTIDDYPRMLTGESIFEILKLIQEVEKIKFVIFDAIDATGKDHIFRFLHENVNEVFDIENLLKITNNIEHVEWGDFFLFKEYPKDWENLGDGHYPHVIAQADTTLRGVDDQYMYIYTQSKNLVDIVKSHYEIEGVKVDLLENLDFPY